MTHLSTDSDFTDVLTALQILYILAEQLNYYGLWDSRLTRLTQLSLKICLINLLFCKVNVFKKWWKLLNLWNNLHSNWSHTFNLCLHHSCVVSLQGLMMTWNYWRVLQLTLLMSFSNQLSCSCVPVTVSPLLSWCRFYFPTFSFSVSLIYILQHSSKVTI